MDLQKKLAHLCDDREWGQADLARRVGAKPSTVQHWFSGRSKPSIKWMIKIARAFSVPVEYLLDDAIEAVSPPPDLPEDERFVLSAYRKARFNGVDAADAIMAIGGLIRDSHEDIKIQGANAPNPVFIENAQGVDEPIPGPNRTRKKGS